METKDVLLMVVALVFFIGAAYVVYQYALPNLHQESEAEKLYVESLKLGLNATDYKYVYKEETAGYPFKTTLIKIGEEKYAETLTPISKRRLYLLENDTVICVKFREGEECSSVKNDSRVKPLVSSTNSLFFNQESIEKDVSSFELLRDKKAIKFDEKIEKKEINGNECKLIKFKISYLNLSVSDFSKLGIGSNNPKEYEVEYCVDPVTYNTYQKTFKYSYSGVETTSSFELLDADWAYSGSIEPPKNLSTKAIDLLFAVNELNKEISTCFNKEGTDRLTCLFTNALREKSLPLCDLTENKKGTCYLNIALTKNDTSICNLIDSNSLIEDCYVEFGAIRKNTATCDLISNTTKKNLCIEVANKNETKSNITIVSPIEDKEDGLENETDISKEDQEFINEVLEKIG